MKSILHLLPTSLSQKRGLAWLDSCFLCLQIVHTALRTVWWISCFRFAAINWPFFPPMFRYDSWAAINIFDSPNHLVSCLACLTLVPGAGNYPGSTVNAPDGSLAWLPKSEYCAWEVSWLLLNLAVFFHYQYSIHLLFLLGWHHLLIHLCCFCAGASISHLTSFRIHRLVPCKWSWLSP